MKSIHSSIIYMKKMRKICVADSCSPRRRRWRCWRGRPSRCRCSRRGRRVPRPGLGRAQLSTTLRPLTTNNWQTLVTLCLPSSTSMFGDRKVKCFLWHFRSCRYLDIIFENTFSIHPPERRGHRTRTSISHLSRITICNWEVTGGHRDTYGISRSDAIKDILILSGNVWVWIICILLSIWDFGYQC